MATMQATYWESQYNDGTVIDGGRQNDYSTDKNVVVVDVTQLSRFSVIGNTNTDSWYAGYGWYRNGVAYDYTYPQDYTMEDGTTLTVDWDSTLNQLKLSQTTYSGPTGIIM